MKPLTESQEGDILVAWLRIHDIKFTHIPNETGSSLEAKRRAIRMKRQGTSRGFVDYVVALPGVGVLYIELKRSKKSLSNVSSEQKEWLAVLESCPGAATYLAYGADDAIKFIQSYLPHKLDSSVF
jgi:Holliday junction resolvase